MDIVLAKLCLAEQRETQYEPILLYLIPFETACVRAMCICYTPQISEEILSFIQKQCFLLRKNAFSVCKFRFISKFGL